MPLQKAQYASNGKKSHNKIKIMLFPCTNFHRYRDHFVPGISQLILVYTSFWEFVLLFRHSHPWLMNKEALNISLWELFTDSRERLVWRQIMQPKGQKL